MTPDDRLRRWLIEYSAALSPEAVTALREVLALVAADARAAERAEPRAWPG